MRLTNLLSRSVAVAALAALTVPVGTSAAKPADRDHDKMPDRWERTHKLNTHRNDARKDTDRDGLKNLAEFRAHTDPRDADTDDDGIKDGKERAGTIVSLTDGVLKLTLFGGSTFTGNVDDRTEVECETPPAAPAPAPASARVRHGGDDNNESGTSGDDESGDDGAVREVGDDEGDDDSGDDEQEGGCSLADLKPGARVDEARIALTSAGVRFAKIELG